ncbi:F-box protein PP2-B11-like [Vicia villosa]|uniref:F-box protein PP2-B11-like n=1 Tax=Vicia villosa TaxID=3911 RepID=UPI00273AECC1|nr:F-box protein PP2-B11-like [Vicia villosa]
MAEFQILPEACIASIISHTTPIDACRLSLVSKTFRSAADSDTVWNKFLQSDTGFMDHVIKHALTPANIRTKKALYMFLCDGPTIIHHRLKVFLLFTIYFYANYYFLKMESFEIQSFQLVRKNAKRIFMLSAAYLNSFWSFPQEYVEWTYTLPGSRFLEVAKLNVCKLQIHGEINMYSLSPNTWYEVYVVFKKCGVWVVEQSRVSFLVSVQVGYNVSGDKNMEWQRPSVRSDGWLETKMGKFFNLSKTYDNVYLHVLRIIGLNFSRRLYLEGIEVRPMN